MAGSDIFENETLAELERVKYKYLGDMIYKMELTYDEVVDIPDKNHIAGSTIGHTPPPKLHNFGDINLMLKSLLTNEVKVNITIVDTRLGSNLTVEKSRKSFIKSFFYTFLCFTQSPAGPLNDPLLGYIQKNPKVSESEKANKITGIDKLPLN